MQSLGHVCWYGYLYMLVNGIYEKQGLLHSPNGYWLGSNGYISNYSKGYCIEIIVNIY